MKDKTEKFKKGDLVIGTARNPYGITSRDTIWQVQGYDYEYDKDRPLVVARPDKEDLHDFNVVDDHFTLLPYKLGDTVKLDETNTIYKIIGFTPYIDNDYENLELLNLKTNKIEIGNFRDKDLIVLDSDIGFSDINEDDRDLL